MAAVPITMAWEVVLTAAAAWAVVESTKIGAVEFDGVIRYELLEFELNWSKESRRERTSLLSV